MSTGLVKLSVREAALLVQMAAHARMSTTGPQFAADSVGGHRKTAASRLVQKGLVECTDEGNYRVTSAGFTQVKSIY